ncbi:MAG TPA: ROK family protein, partial [Stellaceae bacterium]|nr:ROK family protein [Stellaceae bacterium]
HTRRSLSAPEIADFAEHGDAECSATLDRYVHRLARGLAAVINLIDPDAIVLGGGVSGISALYERVPVLWTQYIFSDRVINRLLRQSTAIRAGSGAQLGYGDRAKNGDCAVPRLRRPCHFRGSRRALQ